MGRLTSGGRVAFTGALFALAFAGLAFAGDLGRTAFGPASAGQYGPPKVTICHHVPPKTSRGRGPTRHRTIRVNLGWAFGYNVAGAPAPRRHARRLHDGAEPSPAPGEGAQEAVPQGRAEAEGEAQVG